MRTWPIPFFLLPLSPTPHQLVAKRDPPSYSSRVKYISGALAFFSLQQLWFWRKESSDGKQEVKQSSPENHPKNVLEGNISVETGRGDTPLCYLMFTAAFLGTLKVLLTPDQFRVPSLGSFQELLKNVNVFLMPRLKKFQWAAIIPSPKSFNRRMSLIREFSSIQLTHDKVVVKAALFVGQEYSLCQKLPTLNNYS